jgi:hypothetical protein
MNFQLPNWLQSSSDPTQISLSIESGGKTLIGIIGYFLVLKGLDAGAVTSQLQLIVDQVATGVTLAFTLYHSLMTVYGLVRKLTIRVSPSPAAAPVPVPPPQA